MNNDNHTQNIAAIKSQIHMATRVLEKVQSGSNSLLILARLAELQAELTTLLVAQEKSKLDHMFDSLV